MVPIVSTSTFVFCIILETNTFKRTSGQKGSITVTWYVTLILKFKKQLHLKELLIYIFGKQCIKMQFYDI